MKIHSLIDNDFYGSDSEFIKYNPFTFEKLHKIQNCDMMGVVKAVQSAQRAFQIYKNSLLTERVLLIEKISEILCLKQNEYAYLEALDQALPLSFVRKNSVDLSLQNIESLKKQKPMEAHCSPIGVIVIVASWNLSLRVILDRLVPALLAGNAVIVKVSSESVITAHILSEIILLSGAPKGLVNVIVSQDIEVKKLLISHPGVAAISFVGSLVTALRLLPLINQSSLQNFKKIQISSGSKNSAVFLEDPNDEKFKHVMDSFLIGQGQLVWNSSRLFILEKFERQWEERIKDYLASLRPSEGLEDSSNWTPCLKKNSFYQFGEIRKMASDDQAQLLQASYSLTESQKKNFLPPLFTKDMSRCSTLQQDQIHAPFFILSTVKYPFDVVKFSNVSYYGFAAHIWGDQVKLSKLTDGLDVGMVCYNKSSVEVAGAFSAVKQSGFGLQDFQSFGAFFSNVKKVTE